MEAKITAELMLQFGINNVRGAMFSETRNYTIADIDSLTAFLGHFNDLSYAHVRSTLKEALPLAEVGNAGLYLLSDLSSGVTGEIHFVDSGYSTISMPRLDELKQSDRPPLETAPGEEAAE